MTLASRIVIINNGLIEQIGTPQEIYNKPATRFVANFIGTPQTNLISGTFNENTSEFHGSGGGIFTFQESIDHAPQNKEVIIGIRPEDIEIDGETLEAKIDVVEELGSHRILYCKCGASNLAVVDTGDKSRSSGETVTLGLPVSKIHLFDSHTGKSLSI